MRYFGFGDFIFDTLRDDLLSRSGQPVAITPRALQTLRLFIQHPQELLSKDWLLDQLWQDVIVEENNLNQCVSSLRRTLGCDGTRYIRTVARRGFRLVVPVLALASSPFSGQLEPHARRRGTTSAHHEPVRVVESG